MLKEPPDRLPELLQKFFVERLQSQQAASVHTLASYRDTFRLLLAFIEQKTGERWATTIGPDYQKKEPAILQNWKNWWNDEGKYKYPTPPELAKKLPAQL